MSYGIPYKGSKNLIAKSIIDFLPEGDVLIDICAGGCAVTHAALVQMNSHIIPKWKKVIANDIDNMSLELFKKAINGYMKNENRWIDRETFFKEKNTDPYVKYCWSFGNNGKGYLYSKEIEQWKKALHYALVLKDFSLIEKFIGKIPNEGKENLKLYIKKKYELQSLGRLQSLGSLRRLQSLESLERLQRLKHLENSEFINIEFSNVSYEKVKIPDNAVIYADIPYYGTDCGSYEGFNHKAFFDWAAEQKNIYISSYNIDDDRFMSAWEKPKRNLASQKGTGKLMMERIYTVK
nr:MAG TPA: DNA adenine methylase [Caudoviricetes sp.]